MYLTYVSVAFTTENLKEMPEKREMAEVPDGKCVQISRRVKAGGGQAQSQTRLLLLLVQQNPSCYC